MPIADESKTRLRTLSESEQSTVDAAERTLPNSVRRRAIQREVNEIATRVVNALRPLIDTVRDGENTPRQAANTARQRLAPILMRAFQLGREAIGLPGREVSDREMDVFTDLVEAEVDFFERFMLDIAATEAMDPEQRVGLYGGSAANAFWRGWTTLAPSNAVIEWRVTPAEHCEPRAGFPYTCLGLQAGNPYSKPGAGRDNPLPSLPRQGQTPCIGRCLCYLHLLEPFDAGLKNEVGVEVVEIGGVRVEIHSAEAMRAAGIYRPFAERYAYRQRLHAVDPTGGHDAIAARIRREMEELAGSLGHTIRLRTTTGEILEPISFARARGYTWVPPDDFGDALVLTAAVVIMMNTSDGGEITAVHESPRRIELDGEREYVIDDETMNLLFVRR